MSNNELKLKLSDSVANKLMSIIAEHEFNDGKKNNVDFYLNNGNHLVGDVVRSDDTAIHYNLSERGMVKPCIILNNALLSVCIKDQQLSGKIIHCIKELPLERRLSDKNSCFNEIIKELSSKENMSLSLDEGRQILEIPLVSGVTLTGTPLLYDGDILVIYSEGIMGRNSYTPHNEIQIVKAPMICSLMVTTKSKSNQSKKQYHTS